jgi:hypothetical protein
MENVKTNKGIFFEKKQYEDGEILSFEDVKNQLPSPIYEVDEGFSECYWFAIKTLFKNIHRPTEKSGFVSNFVDAAFNQDIFMWDTSFMTMFCNLLHPYVPGIRSLDNFYCKQRDDGEIAREIVRDSGEDFPFWVNDRKYPLHSFFHNVYGFRSLMSMKNVPYDKLYFPQLNRKPKNIPYYTLDNLNHPIMIWAEWESYLHTGDFARLQSVFSPLFHQYEAMKDQLQHACHLYVTDWASMDNSPRNSWLGFGVDISSEMVLFAKLLLIIANELGDKVPVDNWQKEKESLQEDIDLTTDAIQKYMYDEKDGFFYDVNFEFEKSNIKTAAAFWTILSGVADDVQVKRLIQWLNDKNTFNRMHRVPVLAADEEGYCPIGGYWRGSVWAPMNTMIVLGLELRGHRDLAREIAMNDCTFIKNVFQKTGTIWENYPADELSSGDSDNKDFVGWSGMAPILFLIRYGIGLEWNTENGKLQWILSSEDLSKGKVGCRKYWFANMSGDFIAEKQKDEIRIKVATENSFPMEINIDGKKYSYSINGDQSIVIPL